MPRHPSQKRYRRKLYDFGFVQILFSDRLKSVLLLAKLNNKCAANQVFDFLPAPAALRVNLSAGVFQVAQPEEGGRAQTARGSCGGAQAQGHPQRQGDLCSGLSQTPPAQLVIVHGWHVSTIYHVHVSTTCMCVPHASVHHLPYACVYHMQVSTIYHMHVSTTCMRLPYA